MSAPFRPVLRYHGGKWRLAPWIIQHFPPHRVYVEPFGGAASVLLRKPRSYAEVYNDLDGEVVNVFWVLRDPETAERLRTALTLTPFAREEYARSFDETPDPVEQARRALVRSLTKNAHGDHGYRHEMTDDDHRALAEVLRNVRGMVVLSGYPCDLYDRELYPDWRRETRGALADGARARTEVLWLNPAADRALHPDLFTAAS